MVNNLSKIEFKFILRFTYMEKTVTISKLLPQATNEP